MADTTASLSIDRACRGALGKTCINTAWRLLGRTIGIYGAILFFQVTGIGMSMISMVSMGAAMNLTDYLLTDGVILTWWAVPVMLLVGYLTPLPYNYWRSKALGKACCG